MTRSTDEWLMSRSCHSAMFSSEASALVRTRRARPLTCSQPTGLRLWGMADEPFCRSPKGSSTSRTSVFWRARISVAKVSRLAAQMASAVMTSAWRSRWSTWEAMGAGRSPSRSQTASSTSGGRCEKVPTAPDSLPTGDRLAGALDAQPVPLQLVVPQGQLQAEGHGLGVDAVRAPDHGRVLELVGAVAQDGQQRVHVLQDQRAGLAHQHGQRGVHDVRGRQPVVQPPALGSHALRHVGDEGDDVVLDFLLDGVDPGHVEARLLLDGGQGLRRDDPPLGEHLGGGDLDLEPGREPVLVGPDPGHLRAGVARDHAAWSLPSRAALTGRD
jgi:hypothetical protein